MYRLRTATPDDVDFLVDVVVQATRAQNRLPADFDEPAFRAGYAAWTADLIADHVDSSAMYVIEVDGRPAGRLRLVRSEAQIELAGIQLLPTEQSRGLGTRIITDLLCQAPDDTMTLAVERDNPRAQALYRRLGFTVTGETERELMMVRRPG
jgi:ribosomal protein S18 acetylase RimI-like enzyme